METKGNGIAGAVLMLASAFMAIPFLSKSFGTSLLPLATLAILFVLSGILFLRSWRDGGKADRRPFFERGGRVSKLVAGSVLLVAAIPVLGFYPSVIVYVPTMAFLLGIRSPLLLAVSSIAFVVAVYLVFSITFQTPLPVGLWFGKS